MHTVAILIVLLMAVAFLAGAIGAALGRTGENRRQRILRGICAIMLACGALAFLAQALAAFGGLSFLPASFEWPVGEVGGVVMDPRGNYIVPLKATGRIQVYDQEKRFLRGWFVDAAGGVFKLHVTDEDNIEVFIERCQLGYLFGLDGTLVHRDTYAPKGYSDVVSESSLVVRFPAPWILWLLASPINAWGVGALGMLGLMILDKKGKVAKQPR